MGPAGAHAARLLHELGVGHGQAEAGHQVGHATVAGVAGDLQACQLILQRAVAWFQEVDQEMHGSPVLARDLDTGHQLDTELIGAGPDRFDPVLAIVVGQRDRPAAHIPGQLRDPARRV